MKLVMAPSTGRTHRFNVEEQRTRCGLVIPAERGVHSGVWRVVDEEGPTCRHCAR